MPSFGARCRFAVEYDLLPDHAGVWMNGYCRYWIGDQQVGDFSIITSLRDALFQFEGMRRDVGKRQNPRFLAMSPAHMFRLVDAGLFGSRDISPLELAEKEQWARHNITPGIDVFDLVKIYLVESESIARVVFSISPFSEVGVVEVEAGEVDASLEAVRLSLADVYERAAGAASY
jgi:hypothetical protein